VKINFEQFAYFMVKVTVEDQCVTFLYVKLSGCISAVFYYFYTVGSIIEVKRKGVDCTEVAHFRAKWPVRVNMVGVHKRLNLMSI
jgi:hypothetical protein